MAGLLRNSSVGDIIEVWARAHGLFARMWLLHEACLTSPNSALVLKALSFPNISLR